MGASFAIMGFIFGMMGFVTAQNALARVSKLEKQLEETGVLDKRARHGE